MPHNLTPKANPASFEHKYYDYLVDRLQNMPSGNECELWPTDWDTLVAPDGSKHHVGRLAYELVIGKAPTKARIVRACGNRLCIRPSHLEVKMTSHQYLLWNLITQPEDDSCIVWPYCSGTSKRGQFREGDALHFVDRYVYEMLVGELVTNDDIEHTCGNKLCYRPSHLLKIEPHIVHLERSVRAHGSSDACLLWPFCTTGNNNYGSVTIDGRYSTAHVISYERFVGPIPEDLFVLHTCDTPTCYNPKHLWLGTQKDNVLDCAQKGRRSHVVGERQHRAKLKGADVLIIRNLASRGVSYTELGRRFNVDAGTAASVAQGKSWKHLPMQPPADRQLALEIAPDQHAQ